MRFNPAKSPLLGGLLWVSSVQYFIVQIIVISAWTVPHSLANNFISDLGNTQCGMYAGLAVCSPLHLLMNLSFIIYGLTMIGGSLLLYRHFKHTKLAFAGFSLMVLAGIGSMLVGLFPENSIGSLHSIGAFLALGVGNISVLLLGIGLKEMHPAMRAFTVGSAVISLSAFTLFIVEVYGFVGRGGMERLVSYPFTVWMIGFGLYTLLRLKTRSSPL